jgi:FMN hydrolase / 5-amino-6-(5-phospho-D-ribitylamino)uracil phosphatase
MLDLARIQAISLDLDDTLWPILPIIQRAEKALDDWLANHAPMTAAMFSSPQARADIRNHVANVIVKKKPHLAHDVGAMRLESIRLSFYRAGENPLLADAAYEVFMAERNRVELYKNAQYALELFASRYPLVATTNGNAQLERIGLSRYFKASVSARDVGVGKPDIRIFHEAASRVGVAPENVLHIGDDPYLDVVGAQNAGMQAVWVNRNGKPWDHGNTGRATLEVESLAELMAIFGSPPPDD